MTLLSSRPLLLEIIKLSTTWGISGKGSSLSTIHTAPLLSVSLLDLHWHPPRKDYFSSIGGSMVRLLFWLPFTSLACRGW